MFLLGALPQLLSTTQARTTATFALLPVSLFYAGYVGTERLWYLRLWRGQRFGGSEIWTWSWIYFRRYFILGLGVTVLVLPLVGLGMILGVGHPLTLVLTIASYIVFDIFMTFATPALAYSTDEPSTAFRINLEMIKEHRPAVWLYVFLPSLAAVLWFQFSSREVLGLVPYIAFGVLSTLFNLLMKGATAAFYLRFNEVGEL